MAKKTRKSNMSIAKTILITFVSIMLVTNLIIGAIIFTNWFDYTDKGLSQIVERLNDDVFNVVESYMKNNWSNAGNNDDFNDYLRRAVNQYNSIALVIDKSTGELIANSIKMDNYLRFQDGSRRAVKITNMGYPALTKAYNTYQDTNVDSYKLENIESIFYIQISEYNVDDFQWLIFTAISETHFTRTINYNIKLTIAISLTGLVIAILVYFFITKRLFKPAAYLLDAIDNFTKGDLSQRALVVRDDEVAVAARAFNNMADTIYELVNNLEDKVKERTIELEKANEIMKDNRNNLVLILDSTAEGIYGMDTEGNCTFCNSSSVEILGYSHQDELIGKNMHYEIHHSRRDGSQMSIDECRIIKAMKNGSRFHVDDEVFWKKDGTSFDVEYRVYPQIKDGEILGAVVSFTDITESKKAQEQINYLSYHDPVTGLYNRLFFENELKRIDHNKNLPISIIYGDVNGLKLINDIFGHEKGDELLRKTSEVLTRVSRENDIVARVGGDEFIILLNNTESKNAKKIVERIKAEIATEKISGIKGSISLGTATKTSAEEDIQVTIKNAEEEMYRVKTLERKNVHSGILNDIMDFVFERSPREKLHAANVSRISGEIAANMNLSKTDIRRVKDIGYYHDIGKIILDKSILNKVGELNRQEKKIMEQHTLIGYRLLNLFNETVDMAEVVLAHHERWDGEGYPKKLKGEEIPLYARIISVAEGYDAMTNRADGSGLTHDEAIEEIKSSSATKYDPNVVDSFLQINAIKLGPCALT